MSHPIKGEPLNGFKENEFFLFHGELYYVHVTNDKDQVIVRKIAGVDMLFSANDIIMVSGDTEVHRVCFTIIVP